MVRTLITLIMINFSPFLLAEWEEEKKRMMVAVQGSQHSLTDPDLLINTQSASLLFDGVLLKQGYGVKSSIQYNPIVISNNDSITEKHNNVEFTLKTALFFSENSDLQLGFTSSDKYSSFTSSLLNSVNLSSFSTIEEDKTYDINYSVGKDKGYFYWNTSARYIDTDTKDLNSKHLLQEFTHSIAENEFLWRQSEDTLWGAKLVYSEKQRIYLDNHQNSEVTNLFLTNVTSIFKATQLYTNIGITYSDHDKSLAWDIKQNTFITDYFTFSFSSFRQFDLPAETLGSKELLTEHKVLSRYSPVDYLAVDLSINESLRALGSKKTVSSRAFNLNAVISYQDSWLVSFGLGAEQLTQHRIGNDISQYIADIKVSKVIL